MAETIEIEVGPLYAQLHNRFTEQMDEQYTPQARQQFESFLHEYNQQVERELEQVDVSAVDEETDES